MGFFRLKIKQAIESKHAEKLTDGDLVLSLDDLSKTLNVCLPETDEHLSGIELKRHCFVALLLQSKHFYRHQAQQLIDRE